MLGFGDDEDDELGASAQPTADPSAAPVPVPEMVGPPTAADQQAQVHDFVAQKYGAAADDSGVRAAQDSASRSDTIANIGQALEGFARAKSMAHGGAGVNHAVYDSMRHDAHQGIVDAQATRQAKIQDYLAKNQLARQGVQDTMTAADFGQKQDIGKQKLAQGDPTSKDSQVARAAFKANFPDIANAMGTDLDAMSVNDLGHISQMTDVKAKIAATAEIAKTRAQQHADYLASAKETKDAAAKAKADAVDFKTATADMKDLGKDLDNELASSRTGIGLANNKVNSAKRLMTFADVTPEEIDAAKKDPKAKAALVQKLDQLSPQQYAEVVSGLMGQLNNGGTGSFGQFEELRAPTADQTIANVKQYFSSHQAPANAGELIANNMLTLKNEHDTSQAVLDKHTNKMKAKHPHAFKHDGTRDDAEAMLAAFGGEGALAAAPAAAVTQAPVASGTAQAAPTAPLDPEIKQYATAHKLEYETAERIIAKRRAKLGGQ